MSEKNHANSPQKSLCNRSDSSDSSESSATYLPTYLVVTVVTVVSSDKNNATSPKNFFFLQIMHYLPTYLPTYLCDSSYCSESSESSESSE